MLKPLTTSMEYIVPLYILYASTMHSGHAAHKPKIL